MLPTTVFRRSSRASCFSSLCWLRPINMLVSALSQASTGSTTSTGSTLYRVPKPCMEC